MHYMGNPCITWVISFNKARETTMKATRRAILIFLSNPVWSQKVITLLKSYCFFFKKVAPRLILGTTTLFQHFSPPPHHQAGRVAKWVKAFQLELEGFGSNTSRHSTGFRDATSLWDSWWLRIGQSCLWDSQIAVKGSY